MEALPNLTLLGIDPYPGHYNGQDSAERLDHMGGEDAMRSLLENDEHESTWDGFSPISRVHKSHQDAVFETVFKDFYVFFFRFCRFFETGDL